MDFTGIFLSSDQKNEFYNRMFRQIQNAGRLDKDLAKRMSAKLRELRKVNREWDSLLDELGQRVQESLKKAF